MREVEVSYTLVEINRDSFDIIEIEEKDIPRYSCEYINYYIGYHVSIREEIKEDDEIAVRISSEYKGLPVISEECLFRGLKLRKLDLHGFNVDNVITAKHCFYAFHCDEVIVDRLNFNNLISAKEMFYGAVIKDIDFREWIANKVEYSMYMFAMSNIKTVNLSQWCINKLSYAMGMFQGCDIDTLDISNWNIDDVSINRKYSFMLQEANIRHLISSRCLIQYEKIDAAYMFYNCNIRLWTMKLDKYQFELDTYTISCISLGQIGEIELIEAGDFSERVLKVLDTSSRPEINFTLINCNKTCEHKIRNTIKQRILIDSKDSERVASLFDISKLFIVAIK